MRKTLTISLSLLCTIILLAVLLLFAQAESGQANPTVLYVAPGGACGGGVLPCYTNIQTAVDAAAPGDDIRVAAGIYTDIFVRPHHDITTTGVVTQAVYLTKTITIRGGYSLDFSQWNPEAYTTTLDVQGQGRVLYITGDISPTIQGLHMTGGNALGLGGYSYYGLFDVGGGVFIMTATATLVDNQIISNTAVNFGGGVFLNNSNSVLDNNLTSGNSSTSGGAIAIYRGSPIVSGNIIRSNTATNLGGGLYLFSTDALLTDNLIIGNSANTFGGGVDVASCNPIFNANIISGNSTWKGGGVYLWYSNSTLTNNVISDNQATISGSGIYIGGSKPTLLYTTFARNTGGDGSAIFINSDGDSTQSIVAITNTLLVSSSIGINITGNSTALVDGILWFGTPITVTQGIATITVQHQHTGNPAFDLDSYHLTSGSAAINQGLPTGVLTDIDGQPRPIAVSDLGADEYWRPGSPWIIYLPLVKR